MNGQEAQEKVFAAIDSGGEDADADAHCRVCAECAAARLEMASLWSDLGRLPAPTLEGVKALEEARAWDAAALRPPRKPWAWVWADWAASVRVLRWPLFAGLACACFAVGLSIGVLRHGAAAPALKTFEPEWAALRAEMAELKEAVALGLLRHPSASDRLRGVAWFEGQGPTNPDAVDGLLRVLESDPHVNVRLAAVDALASIADEERARRGLVRSLERPNSPLVRIALIDAVSQAKAASAVASLRAIMDNEMEDEAVRARARAAIQSLI